MYDLKFQFGLHASSHVPNRPDFEIGQYFSVTPLSADRGQEAPRGYPATRGYYRDLIKGEPEDTL